MLTHGSIDLSTCLIHQKLQMVFLAFILHEVVFDLFWITKVSLILFTALLCGYPVISWFRNFLVRSKDGQVFSTIKLEFGLGLFSVSLKKFHDNFAWISFVFFLHLLDLGLDCLVADFLHHFMMNPCYNIL